jgi:hypothetical protein
VSESAVLPDAVTNLGFCKFQQDGGNSADEQGDLILEDTPGDRVRSRQCRFPFRVREVDGRTCTVDKPCGRAIYPVMQQAGKRQGAV